MRVSAKVDYALRALAEIAASQRGAEGGYRLAKPAAEISEDERLVSVEHPGGGVEELHYEQLVVGRYKGIADVMGVRFRGFPALGHPWRLGE